MIFVREMHRNKNIEWWNERDAIKLSKWICFASGFFIRKKKHENVMFIIILRVITITPLFHSLWASYVVCSVFFLLESIFLFFALTWMIVSIECESLFKMHSFCAVFQRHTIINRLFVTTKKRNCHVICKRTSITTQKLLWIKQEKKKT